MVEDIKQGIVDDYLQDASPEQYENFMNVIKLMTKLGHITWQESYTSTAEYYSATIDSLNLEAHLGYDATTEDLYMFVEDLENKVSALYGDKYFDDLTEIYTNMVTTSNYDCWDKDTELVDTEGFVLGVDYESQILGEVAQIFHTNINYNNEMLG